MPKKPTTWIDAHVGRKLCVLRKSSGVSQQKLAEQLGVTYQQVQKYEGGTNRVSTSFLLRVAQMFGVPLDYFFEGVDALSGQPAHEAADGDAGRIASFVATAEGQELVRAYLAVEDPKVRRRVMSLLKSLGEGGEE
jgi:transcriptional regulator with XRE-family HTH domain